MAPPYHILILARPGYQRKGIESTLLAMDDVIIQTAATCEIAKQFLSASLPDLFLVSPRGLDLQSIHALCDSFFAAQKNSVLLYLEPGADRLEWNNFFCFTLFEVETSDQLKDLISKKLQTIL